MNRLGKFFFFHSCECQKIQTKNSFDEMLSLEPLKVNSNASNKNQFCKGLSK
jgi:hypothetical protein